MFRPFVQATRDFVSHDVTSANSCHVLRHISQLRVWQHCGCMIIPKTPYVVIITVTKTVPKSQLSQLAQMIIDNSRMTVKQISTEKNTCATFDTVTFKTYALALNLTFELSFETHMLVILPVNCHINMVEGRVIRCDSGSCIV